MKTEDLYNGITDIRDDIIDKAEIYTYRKAKKHRKLWISSFAAVFTMMLLAGILLWTGSRPMVINACVIAEPEYPEMAPYPNEREFGSDYDGFSRVYDAWITDRRMQLDQPEGYADGLEPFFSRSIRQFLSDTDGKNRVYSPLNVYMALGMLAELTDGNSRQQILDLLGADSIGNLRTQAFAVWNSSYCNDGAVTSILASSLWLNQDVSFVQSTMDTLAEIYYASSYQGKMGSEEFNQMLQDWLNAQTDGLLEEQASGIVMDPDTILALATTICFRAKWLGEFSESQTTQDTFHSPAKDMICSFMHKSDSRYYYWGDHFSAVGLSLEGNASGCGSMWLLLPDEGISPDDLLKEKQAMDFLLSGGEWDNRKSLVVNLSVPKFDAASDLSLIPGLRELGVTDVFDFAVSDFTPMTTDMDGICISKVQHAARVMIDEEGCSAAAYTVMTMFGGGMPPADEIDFVVDRPFLFAITGENGLPLFAGVVNQPL